MPAPVDLPKQEEDGILTETAWRGESQPAVLTTTFWKTVQASRHIAQVALEADLDEGISVEAAAEAQRKFVASLPDDLIDLD